MGRIQWARASQFNWVFDNLGDTPLQKAVAGVWSNALTQVQGDGTVAVAAPNPDKIDGDAVLSVLPEGRRRINVVEGGVRFPVPTTAEEAKTHTIIVVIAIIVVLVDVDKLDRA